MKEDDAINRLAELINKAEKLVSKNTDDQDFKKWRRDTEIAIEKIFGEKKKTY